MSSKKDIEKLKRNYCTKIGKCLRELNRRKKEIMTTAFLKNTEELVISIIIKPITVKYELHYNTLDFVYSDFVEHRTETDDTMFHVELGVKNEERK